MKFPLRFVLILTAVIAAAFLLLAVACGGDEEEEGPAAGETPAAAETPEETPAGEVGELPSIPAYPGAEEVSSGTFTGAGAFPIPLTGDIPIGPEEFAEVRYTFYETSDSSDKVSDFYEKEFKDWKEEWTFSMEELGQKGEVVVWSKDDGNTAAWLAAFEDEGTTNVAVAVGTSQ